MNKNFNKLKPKIFQAEIFYLCHVCAIFRIYRNVFANLPRQKFQGVGKRKKLWLKLCFYDPLGRDLGLLGVLNVGLPTYKLARQAMLVIKRFRGRTLRIRNVAKECQLSRKVGYKMTRARKKI